MRNLRRYTLLVAALALLNAEDFGDPKDVKQVRSIVAAKFHHAAHASVSHDWALCTAYSGLDNVSVVLHRVRSAWKIVAHDGGAYGQEQLRALSVPEADIPPLLKAYQ